MSMPMAARMADTPRNGPTNATRFSTLPYPVNKERLVPFCPFSIHSNYTLQRKLGQGTSGSVYLAIEQSSGLQRAVKKVDKKAMSDLSLFRREITLLKALDHPNIVRIYETFEDYASVYMVMEYCEGDELFDYVTRSKFICEADAAFLMHQILSAVCYIHRKNIVHRDLKPENFMFMSKRSDGQVKLIDFDLARRFNKKRHLRTPVGTLLYVAPEVLNACYDSKCDIWSAGVILHLLSTGSLPFSGPSDASITARIREGRVTFTESGWTHRTSLSKNLVERLLCRNPAERLTAEQALRHPWFALFIPQRFFGFLRPLSSSCSALHTDKQLHTNTSQGCLNKGAALRNLPSPLASFLQRSRSWPFGCADSGCRGRPFDLLDLCDQRVTPRSDITSNQSTLAVHNSFDVFQLHWSVKQNVQCTMCEDLHIRLAAASYLITKWKHFSHQNQLQRAALRLVAQHMTEDERVEPLRAMFLALDANHDGHLTSDEVFDVLRLLSLMTKQLHCTRYRYTQKRSHSAPPALVYAPNHTQTSDFRHHNASKCFRTESPNDQLTVSCVYRPGPAQSDTDYECGVHRSNSGIFCTSESWSEGTDDEDAEQKTVAVLTSDLSHLTKCVALDGKDAVEYCDFLAATMDVVHWWSEAAVRSAFRIFDRDGDGYISASELRSPLGWADVYSLPCTNHWGSLTARNPNQPQHLTYHDTNSAAQPSSFTSSPRLCTIDEEMERIFESCDYDGDGVIGYNDFVTTLRATISSDAAFV